MYMHICTYVYTYIPIYVYTCMYIITFISRWYPHFQWLLSSPSPIPTGHAAPSPSWRRVASLASDRRIGWWWSGCRRHRGRWRPRIFSSEFFLQNFPQVEIDFLSWENRYDFWSSMIISKKNPIYVGHLKKIPLKMASTGGHWSLDTVQQPPGHPSPISSAEKNMDGFPKFIYQNFTSKCWT